MSYEKSTARRWLLPLIISVVLVPLLFFWISGYFGNSLSEKNLDLAKEGIRRAAVQCYALEGAYPADFSYLQEKYGVSIDTGRYFVDYQYIASNLMPDITVLPIR